MSKKDEEKTVFITPCGTYFFVRMPFGLKSARSTFARAVQIGFEPQLHRNIEAYMDDIVVKTKDRSVGFWAPLTQERFELSGVCEEHNLSSRLTRRSHDLA